MDSQQTKLIIISDSTVEPIGNYLSRYEENILSDIAPFNQIVPTLLSDNLQNYKLAVVLSQLRNISSGFADYLESGRCNPEKIYYDVKEFCSVLKSASNKVDRLIVYNWVKPRWHIDNLLTGWNSEPAHNIDYILSSANRLLAEEVSNIRNIHVIEQTSLLLDANNMTFDPKLWAIGKMLYSSFGFEELAGQIASFVRASAGRNIKLIAVDLDNTLWGGLVGELGWENIKLGGTDPIGESFVLFQKQLKLLKNRGILLAIVSANDESPALEAIDKHPEMILKRDDFVTWRINWNSKADNVYDIAQEVNIGLQSIVFIDDTPEQRSLVRETHPEVLVPDWPSDPVMYPYALKKLHCFEQFYFTDEDKKRTEMIKGEQKRQASLSKGISREQWLKNLNVVVKIEKISEANLTRAIQLLNRTNQFNLSTRRMSEESFLQWINDKQGRTAYAISAKDKFGEYGLIGLLSLELNDDVIKIIDFLVSCRVLGRGVEQTIIAFAAKKAKDNNCPELIAEFIPTAKNNPMREFLEKIADERNNDVFIFNVRNHDFPEHITREMLHE